VITVVEKGKVIHVEPDLFGAKDILEVAQALIETFGWNNTTKGKYTPSSEEQGYTLHDAIGEAGVRITAANGMVGSKEGFGYRAGAESLVERHTPLRMNIRLSTKDANDAARSKEQIIRILEKARGV
jgi:hypothetical protein